jgi:hypothetical protein
MHAAYPGDVELAVLVERKDRIICVVETASVVRMRFCRMSSIFLRAPAG